MVLRLKDRIMKIAVKTIEGGSAGEIELADGVFAVPVRKDILQRCVVWQLSRRQQGTHKTKGRAEVTATAKKMYAQKGTGRARHGNEAAPQFRGGGKAFGPVVRSHASDLPKKVRKLALRTALSAKAAEGKLIVVETATLAEPKTAQLKTHFGKLGVSSVLSSPAPRSTPTSRAPRPTSPMSMCCRSRAPTSTTSCAATRWC
jgi:large subunit ribosomal protein L4